MICGRVKPIQVVCTTTYYYYLCTTLDIGNLLINSFPYCVPLVLVVDGSSVRVAMLGYLLSLVGLSREWPQYTLDDVRKHNDRHSLWIVAGNSVYDVTSIVDSHPGGANALLQRGGGVKDCVIDFGYHSRSAQSLWASLKVGEVRFDNTERSSCAEAVDVSGKGNVKWVASTSPLNHACVAKDSETDRDCCYTNTVESHISSSDSVIRCHCTDCFHRQPHQVGAYWKL
uniref:Uncharacterized protein TCIL3000_3_2180 n=1 Tax=Trypanosoma congolense (strain IL3000) TaxID=1068625 RepID=G0UK81_TRYCI|nr:unnamed protein product [Trypanosoma congolense IL3000]